MEENVKDLKYFKDNAIKNILDNKKIRIGIRPVIDARMGGVRESLEDQTLNMARNLAKFLSENIKNNDGKPLECVIPDACIGGVTEAVRVEREFLKNEVEATITVTPSWCYGFETMDMDPIRPKAIWGFNGTERPGAVYLASVLAAHNQKGLPAFGIYGEDVQEIDDTSIPKDVSEKLLRFTKASLAAATMKSKSYLSIGSVSMGIAGSIINPDFFEKYLGMRTEYIDMTEVSRRMSKEIYDKDEYNKALKWAKENLKEGPDINSPEKRRTREQKNEDWENSIKITLIARDLMVGNPKLAERGFTEEALGHNAIASGFQGQRHWYDYLTNCDFTETILNSSFDWNGIRKPYIFATENDSLNAVSMLFGHLLTNTAQIFSDVRTYWSPEAVKQLTGKKLTGRAENGMIHLINSGSTCLDGTGLQEKDGKSAIKPFWEIAESEVEKCINATRFCPADLEYFRGGGFSTNFLTIGNMPVTMSRINIINGLGPVMQIAEGFTIDLPNEIHDVLNKRTSSTWPTTWFAPNITGRGVFKDVYSVMDNWGANHGAISYGHIGADLITMASILRIPVTMHNVPEDKIFRASTWKAFGDPKQDYVDLEACRHLGPLY